MIELRPYLRFARSLVFRDRPVYAHFALTHRCNLRCATCSVWKDADASAELRIEEIERLAGTLGATANSLPTGRVGVLEETADAFVVTTVLGQSDGEVKTASVSWSKRSFDDW